MSAGVATEGARFAERAHSSLRSGKRGSARVVGCGLRDALQDREATPGGIEVLDDEGGLRRALARSSPRRLDGRLVRGRRAEDGLDGRGSLEPLVGPEAKVVDEGQLEPALEILAGEGEVEAAEAGQLLQRPPEPLEPCGGEGWSRSKRSGARRRGDARHCGVGLAKGRAAVRRRAFMSRPVGV